MTVKFTRRNHYNPCFWTAHWNPEYHRRSVSAETGLVARVQRVHALSVKSSNIFETAVEKVHYDKNLGVAEITREAAEDFVRRNKPGEYEDFRRENVAAPYPVLIDFEEILGGIERMPPYQVLVDVVRRGKVETKEEKVQLAALLVLQLLRSHAIMNSMLEWQTTLQQQKFELFVKLRWMIGDADALYQLIIPFVTSRWTFYATALDTFPLCDSPVLVKPESVLFAISPRLLLEIDRTVAAPPEVWRHRDGVPGSRLAEFRRRTIGNTFREIIFSDPKVLEEWRSTMHFQRRAELMKDAASYNRLVRKEGSQELWQVNAYGNR